MTRKLSAKELVTVSANGRKDRDEYSVQKLLENGEQCSVSVQADA